jgi:DNA polymerase (family X)
MASLQCESPCGQQMPEAAETSMKHLSAVKRRPEASVAQPVTAQLHNEDVAAAFDEMAELLAISGENPFRIRAYQRAAQVVRTLPRPCAELGTAALDELPGIGADLAGKIQELLSTGRLRALDQVRAHVPASLRELLALPSMGPVRVRALHTIGVDSIGDLRQALDKNRLRGLRGFGPILQNRLRQALSAKASEPKRWPWSVAAQYAEPLRTYLQSLSGIVQVEIAGSYRRGRETVGDLDLVVCGPVRFNLAAALRRYADVRELTAEGPTRCSAVLRNGMHVDLRLVPPESAGAALYYFTGSRDHNVALRLRAVERGLKLNEYGLFRGRRRIAGATEQEILSALDLPWIAPELRERRGEIEAAEEGRLPRLIELRDLQGDLHCHTQASDGRESLTKMVASARSFGLKYLAITDHAQHLGIVRGLDAERLARQGNEIDKLNATLHDFVVLKGAEVDILEDGALALPDTVLRRLDVVVAAVHTHFGLARAKQTARIVRALEHPCVSILAHPTGRLLGERAGYAIDFDAVITAARHRHCFLELNAQPQRLDMDDVMAQAAREQGVLVSIDSDAHSSAELAHLAGGIRQARRGWLRREDVLNAHPLAELRALLAAARR